jgi:hypothetical protein
MAEEEQKTDIVVSAPVIPLLSPEEAVEAWNRFLELKRQLLTDEDYQTIAGKKFTKKSGFRKLALAFNISDRVVDSQHVWYSLRDALWRIGLKWSKAEGEKHGHFSGVVKQ